jgi:tetratricopeptide (TPR) repeat protein
MSRFFNCFLLISLLLLSTGPVTASAADGEASGSATAETAVSAPSGQALEKRSGLDIRKEAVELFMDNRPVEAIPLLQQALRLDPADPDLYMYLAVSYEQIGNHEAALKTYGEALARVEEKKASFYYNMGNTYGKLGRYDQALESYDRAVSLEPDLSEAYLNRANLRVRNSEYGEAIADYRLYLSLDPDTGQRENIEKMISLLSGKIVAAEKTRLEEERRREEEERRQQELLEQVLNSLEASGEETKNISAGTGEVKEYDQGFDIVD